MRRKSLYTESESYTIDAADLDRNTGIALKPLFDEYIKKGYSIREITNIIGSCVSSLGAEYVIKNRHRKD
jgi:hypothetical protein